MARRICLALAVAFVLGPAGPASADVLCVGEGTESSSPCSRRFAELQPALDAASLSAQGDAVVVGVRSDGSRTWDTAQGFHYSDRGVFGNDLVIGGSLSCDRGGCAGPPRLRKTTPGGTLLSFTGSDGALVDMSDLDLEGPPGGTGLRLGPRSAATSVTVAGAAVGVILGGSATWPARLFNTPVSARDVAVEIPQGNGTVEFARDLTRRHTRTTLLARTAVRAGGPGLVSLSGAKIAAQTAVTAVRARVADTILSLRRDAASPGAVTGFSIACPDPGSADASLQVADVTLLGDSSPGSLALEVRGRGGDSQACDATADVTSSVVWGFERPAAVVGEAGTGSVPVPGAATGSIRYSDVDAPAIALTGPASVNTTSPGGNFFADPRVHAVPITAAAVDWDTDLAPRWDSPLIDRGDPAARGAWPELARPIVNGRRDVGAREYLFRNPGIVMTALPARAAVGTKVNIYLDRSDPDGDPLLTRVEVNGRPVAIKEPGDDIPRRPELSTVFRSPGPRRVVATLTDPTGRSDAKELVINVQPPRIRSFELDRTRIRAGRRGRGFAPWCNRGTTVSYELFGRVPVRFAVRRALRDRRGRFRRWKRLAGGYTQRADEGENEVCFRGRLRNRRLRVGTYRIVAKPRAGRAVGRTLRIVR